MDIRNSLHMKQLISVGDLLHRCMHTLSAWMNELPVYNESSRVSLYRLSSPIIRNHRVSIGSRAQGNFRSSLVPGSASRLPSPTNARGTICKRETVVLEIWKLFAAKGCNKCKTSYCQISSIQSESPRAALWSFRLNWYDEKWSCGFCCAASNSKWLEKIVM